MSGWSPGRLLIGLLVAMTGALATATSATAVDPSPPARVLTNFETANPTWNLFRDGGLSAPIPGSPGQALWIFGDTGIDTPGGDLFAFGSFAARGPFTVGKVPQGLSHLPTPPAPLPTFPNNNGLAQFVGNPAPGTYQRPNGQACTYNASWVVGATPGPSGTVEMDTPSGTVTIPNASAHIFVTFIDVCVYHDEDIEPFEAEITQKASGIAAYYPPNNTFTAIGRPFQVGSPTATMDYRNYLFTPVFSGGYMYAYAPSTHCPGGWNGFGLCTGGAAHTLRVPQDELTTGNAYDWKSGTSTWSSTAASAIDIIPATQYAPMGQIDVHDFTSMGKGYLLLEQYGFGGNYRIWQAATPGGNWTQIRDSQIGECVPDGCYAIWAHPELSTEDHLLYSWFSMESGDQFVRVRDMGTVPDL